MSTRRRHLGVGAALSVFVQGGPLAAATVLSVVLARTIGPSGTGHFSLLVTLTGFTAMIVSLGLSTGITYEVSRRRWSVREAFRTSYALGFVMGLVGFAGGLLAFVLLHGSVFSGISTWLAVVALASLPPVLAYTFADSILLARERYEGYAALELSHSATLLVFGAGLAIAFGLSGAVVGVPAAALVGALMGVFLLRAEARTSPPTGEGDSLGRAVRFGLQSWGANLLQQISYRWDVLILAAYATASDVGVYSVALTLTAVAWVLPQALQTVVFPRVASLDQAASAGEISSAESDLALAKAVRHGVLLTLPTALVISVLLLLAVPLLYGSAFHDTIWLGFILLPGTLMLGIGKILGSGVTGRGYPRYALYVGASGAIVALVLYFALIPVFDAWGAAVASSLTYAFGALLGAYFFRRVTKLGLRESFLPRAEDVADYGGLLRLARAWRPTR